MKTYYVVSKKKNLHHSGLRRHGGYSIYDRAPSGDEDDFVGQKAPIWIYRVEAGEDEISVSGGGYQVLKRITGVKKVDVFFPEGGGPEGLGD